MYYDYFISNTVILSCSRSQAGGAGLFLAKQLLNLTKKKYFNTCCPTEKKSLKKTAALLSPWGWWLVVLLLWSVVIFSTICLASPTSSKLHWTNSLYNFLHCPLGRHLWRWGCVIHLWGRHPEIRGHHCTTGGRHLNSRRR